MRLLLALTLFAPSAAFAQFQVSALSDPLLPNRTPLAEAAEVPTAFLLGSPGPSALFLNPARAARADHRFAYGTVQGFGLGTPVAFSGLFGSGDRRWLVTVDNVLATQSREDLDETASTTPPGNGSGTLVQRRLFENEYAFSTTRARLLLVGRTDFGGYAFGLFGGFRTLHSAFLRDEDFTRTVAFTTPDEEIRLDQREVHESVQRFDEDDLALGAELAFAGRTWDLAAALSYQRRTADAVLSDDRQRVREETRTRPDFMTERFDETLQAYEQRAEGSPSSLAFDVLGTLGAGLSRGDYLFASASGSFGGGTADFFSSSSFTERIRQVQDGEVVLETVADGGFGPERGARDLDGLSVTATLGYVYSNRAPRRGRRSSRDGLTLLAGILPSITHRRAEAVRLIGGEAFLNLDESELTGLALDLPLYARYPVTERFDLFGGGVLSYSYTGRTSTSSPLAPDDPATAHDLRSRRHESEQVASGGRVYAGAVFTARSGFTAQAAFRGDLAQFTGWTVSLGYRF